jgi:cellulose synthase/poly-beta-1,6-N-acetylglucosamine synthase-like glycosyltransferase
LILDALAWASTVLILAVSIYSIRSIIFICVVARARANSGRRQQDNNNTTGNTLLHTSDRDHKVQANKKDEEISNIAKAGANLTPTAYMAASLDEQHDVADGFEGIDLHNAAAAEHSPADKYPFISILVATHNESLVIERLLKSFSGLTYPADRFEIMIIDDSSDDTYQKIQSMLARFQNLKVIHRDNRDGWKGGALNVGLEDMDKRVSNVLVVDADNILLEDTLQRFVSRFIQEQSIFNEKGVPILAIQGFPISKSNPEDDNEWWIKAKRGNWLARAIDFRLSQRNMIEFAAKDILNLPVQITGSLFMIRADVIKSIKFSNDLCEDWDLTINLYCPPKSSSTDVLIWGNSTAEQISHRPTNNICLPKLKRVSSKPKIIFDKELVSYCEATTDLAAYFRQRMRVSEGHTRGLRRGIGRIAWDKMLSLVDKVELFLNGLQYTKFISILGIEIINTILILMFISGDYSSQQLMNLFALSFSLQAANLALALVRSILAVRICRDIRCYGIKDLVSLLALTTITTPAFVIGSLRGLLQDNGTFYRTPRNLAEEPKFTQTAVSENSSRRSSSPTGASA